MGKERVSAFLVKDILKILEAYGFKETSKMASKEVIDSESLKILSKLSDLIR